MALDQLRRHDLLDTTLLVEDHELAGVEPDDPGQVVIGRRDLTSSA
jgi:hypothetical protein